MSQSLVRIYNSFPLEFGGGGEASLTTIATGLSRTRHLVEYVADSHYRGTTRVATLEAVPEVNGFTYRREPFVDYSGPWMKWVSRGLPNVDSMSSDAVHLVVLDRVPARSFLERAKKKGVRLGLLLHGLSPLDAPRDSLIVSAYQTYVRRSLASLARRGSLDSCQIQIFNASTSHFFERMGICESRLHVIPCGHDPTEYGPELRSDRFRVTFLGRTERLVKGIDTLVNVIRELVRRHRGRIAITIAGSGRDSRLLGEVVGLPGVSVEGFITQAAKRRLLSESHILLTTSRIEPFSMATVEGLLSGALVITTPVTGPKEILAMDSSFGRVGPARARELAQLISEAFQWWLTDRESFEAGRRFRRERAGTLFTAARMIERYDRMVCALGG